MNSIKRKAQMFICAHDLNAHVLPWETVKSTTDVHSFGISERVLAGSEWLRISHYGNCRRLFCVPALTSSSGRWTAIEASLRPFNGGFGDRKESEVKYTRVINRPLNYLNVWNLWPYLFSSSIRNHLRFCTQTAEHSGNRLSTWKSFKTESLYVFFSKDNNYIIYIFRKVGNDSTRWDWSHDPL